MINFIPIHRPDGPSVRSSVASRNIDLFIPTIDYADQVVVKSNTCTVSCSWDIENVIRMSIWICASSFCVFMFCCLETVALRMSGLLSKESFQMSATKR